MHDGQSRRRRIIDSLQAARELFAPAFARARDERLYIAHLDSSRRLMGLRIRYAQSDSMLDFPVREIVADAIALQSAGLVLAHNHPSGDPTPTAADIEATRGLVQVGRPLGLAVRDHLVFGRGGFVSFRERGLL
ncbi:MAG TPA: JAB domain-containing protein [Sphingomonas sp.]|nr:JAB domain-containing protein [Sphingomonas sp.]